jgi:hypothetical protein
MARPPLGPRGMNRRDFLLLRREPASRVAEVSGCRLYMRCLDAQFSSSQADVASPIGDTWEGEPPQVFERQSIEEMFHRFSLDLEGVDILRITDVSWLTLEPVRGHVDRLLATFRSRGGRVELVAGGAAGSRRGNP